ncbi:hypothetical protein Tco_1281189 [Tanacetum coccineum]
MLKGTPAIQDSRNLVPHVDTPPDLTKVALTTFTHTLFTCAFRLRPILTLTSKLGLGVTPEARLTSFLYYIQRSGGPVHLASEGSTTSLGDTRNYFNKLAPSDHNKKNTVDPLRLNFELEDTNADCSTIVKGKTAGDADLRKPFKEALRTPLTRKIIKFAGPEYKMPTNIKLYDETTDLEDHLNRINEWSKLREAFAARYSVRKACFKEPHEITKIVWKSNESLTAFTGRWTVETGFILGVPQVMKISSFMDSFKCHELVKRYSDKVPQTVEEMTIRLMTSFALKKLSLA